MRYKISIEYDGTNYFGWQKQKDLETIQENLEKAIFLLTQEKVEIIGSGRTDVGVHAINQIAHFDLNKNFDSKTIVKGLNFYLNDFIIQKNKILNYKLKTKYINYFNINTISVKTCEIVNDDFHARFSSKIRHYQYIILNQSENSTFLFNRVWPIRNQLNINNMIEASKYFLGKHDFSSFRSSDCQALSPIKTLNECNIINDKNNQIIFNLSAKSFLHHMVRNLIGTLKDVGLGKKNPTDMEKILLAKNRQFSGVMAPACGLYFVDVEY